MPTKTAAPAEHVRQAIDELDQARAGASEQARDQIDAAITRLREAADELGARAQDQMSEFQGALDSAAENLRIEFARRAVRAQKSISALTEISVEVRRRKAELTS